MDAKFFAVAQGRVAEELQTRPSLVKGVTDAGAKRAMRMVAAGLVAAAAFVAAAPEASAMTPEQMQDYMQRSALQAVQREQYEKEQQRNQLHRNADQRTQYAALGLVQAGVNGLVEGVRVGVRGLLTPTAVQPQSGQVRPQVQGPAFYSPRDLGMPERFTQVSQRTRVGMVVPGGMALDLTAETPITINMVRAMTQLESGLESLAKVQAQMNDVRLSVRAPTQQEMSLATQNLAASNNNVDRAIESYMRMSNEAGMRGYDTGPFNRLVAKMVLDNVAPDQQVNMSVNSRQSYGYSR